MHAPNQQCRVFPYAGTNIKSKPQYAEPVIEGCSVVTFRLQEVTTSVRADTSASQGKATINRATIRMLFTPLTSINFGAKVELLAMPNEFFRIVEMIPNFDALGQLDHYQCDLERL